MSHYASYLKKDSPDKLGSVGRHDVYISIHESNSRDGTKEFLSGFDQTLANLGIGHRISMIDDSEFGSSGRPDWPYDTSTERIAFLSSCRNKAMESIQSPDDQVRIPDWAEYTKIIFLDDIVFKWQDIIELIVTKLPVRADEGGGEGRGEGKEDYHLACAMDFGSTGMSLPFSLCGVT